MSLKETVTRACRNRSGPAVARAVQPLQNFGLSLLGHGTGELPVTRSGEVHVVEQLAHLRSPTVFDVGAFHGEYAALVRARLDEPTVHCFEPHPQTFATLAGRTSEAVHQLAFGRVSGQSVLFSPPGMPTMSSLVRAAPRAADADATTIEVQVETLTGFCAQHGIDTIDLLKLDVEGVELDVLEGAREMLPDRIGYVQFEFGPASLASRIFLRDFYAMLAPRTMLRVTPRGLVPLGAYRPEYEVFTGATNYLAAPSAWRG